MKFGYSIYLDEIEIQENNWSTTTLYTIGSLQGQMRFTQHCSTSRTSEFIRQADFTDRHSPNIYLISVCNLVTVKDTDLKLNHNCRYSCNQKYTNQK